MIVITIRALLTDSANECFTGILRVLRFVAVLKPARASDLFLNHMVIDMKHTVEVMIPKRRLKRVSPNWVVRLLSVKRQRQRYGAGGSAAWLIYVYADLCREVQVSHEVDFMTASSTVAACPPPVM